MGASDVAAPSLPVHSAVLGMARFRFRALRNRYQQFHRGGTDRSARAHSRQGATDTAGQDGTAAVQVSHRLHIQEAQQSRYYMGNAIFASRVSVYLRNGLAHDVVDDTNRVLHVESYIEQRFADFQDRI